MIKAAFFDFDWTLFDHKTREYTPSTIKAINELNKNGVFTAIVSARNYHSLKGLKAFDLFPFKGYALNNGGAAFIDGTCLYEEDIAPKTINHLIDICLEHQLSYLLVSSKGTYVKLLKEDDPNFKGHYAVFYEAAPIQIEETHIEDPILCFQVFCDESYDYLFKDTKGIHFNRFASTTFELTARAFSKKTAVQAMLKHLGFKKNEAIAFGDDLNDLDMFHSVGTSVCLGNGKEEAKAAATYVTDQIEKDGIKKALQKFNLIKKDLD